MPALTFQYLDKNKKVRSDFFLQKDSTQTCFAIFPPIIDNSKSKYMLLQNVSECNSSKKKYIGHSSTKLKNKLAFSKQNFGQNMAVLIVMSNIAIRCSHSVTQGRGKIQCRC